MKRKTVVPYVVIVLATVFAVWMYQHAMGDRYTKLYTPPKQEHTQPKQEQIQTAAVPEEPAEAMVPILMYHHLDMHSESAWTITPETLERQLQTILQAGYQPVSMQQLVDFVYHGAALPDKPMCITFDDGYLSNYTLAYPILQEYSIPATIFAIGSSIGRSTYGNTDIPVLPHFSYQQACEMVSSGYVAVQSHTYDMHQSSALETRRPIRRYAAPLPHETDADFSKVMYDDLECYRKEYAAHMGKALFALAYPKGVHSPISEQVAHKAGYLITLTTDAQHRNVIRVEEPESLYLLGRMNVSEQTTDEQLLQYLADGTATQ
ncbi:MAG: polysaccharide deacetylase family protein [Eubacteriales bacterium]|nr:polysaccharide deacetylase family protein [Eubacteriales bacterium]